MERDQLVSRVNSILSERNPPDVGFHLREVRHDDADMESQFALR